MNIIAPLEYPFVNKFLDTTLVTEMSKIFIILLN